MWEQIMRAQPLPAREVLVLLWREPTILSIQILVQGLALFLNREPSFFPWSTLVNPNLKGTVVLIQPTVISCIINFVFASHELPGHGAQERRTVLHFSSIIGMDSGTCECKMSFCRDNWAKHDIYSSMGRSCRSTTSGRCFTIGKASSTVSVGGPPLKKSLPLSRVVVQTLGALAAGRRNF